MNEYFQRLSETRERIESACISADRKPESVALLAVGKLHPAASVAALYALGQQDFGENRINEAVEKQKSLREPGINWHFIGPIQSNKTREIAAHFNWAQSVDRAKILKRLSAQRPPELGPINICLQVNIDHEPQKAGVLPSELTQLAEFAATLPQIRLRGLMCIPRVTRDTARARDSFIRTRQLWEELRAEGYELDTLSMGMSSDLGLAIENGSTMVRIGTALFGPRR